MPGKTFNKAPGGCHFFTQICQKYTRRKKPISRGPPDMGFYMRFCIGSVWAFISAFYISLLYWLLYGSFLITPVRLRTPAAYLPDQHRTLHPDPGFLHRSISHQNTRKTLPSGLEHHGYRTPRT